MCLPNYAKVRINLANFIGSLKRLFAFLIFIVILSVSALYVFDLFVAAPIFMPMFIKQAFRIIIILAFTILLGKLPLS